MHAVPLTSMTIEALKDVDVTKREAERSKNMFALGLMSWLYGRPTERHGRLHPAQVREAPGDRRGERARVQGRLGLRRDERGLRGLVRDQAGEARAGHVPQDHRQPGARVGLVAASVQSGLPLFLGAYPITPASALLEDLARHKNFGVRTFQAEDEIAAAGAALGASFGGALGVTARRQGRASC